MGLRFRKIGEESCGNGGDEGLQSGEEKLVDSGLFGEGEIENCFVGEAEVEDEFVDPRCDSFSVASSNEFNDLVRLGAENLSVMSNQFREFYDAMEGAFFWPFCYFIRQWIGGAAAGVCERVEFVLVDEGECVEGVKVEAG